MVFYSEMELPPDAGRENHIMYYLSRTPEHCGCRTREEPGGIQSVISECSRTGEMCGAAWFAGFQEWGDSAGPG